MTYIPNDKSMQRVVTFLDREEVDFLDKLGKDALFSTGTKVSRAKLIEWLVDFTKHLSISGEGIKSEEDFETKIRKNIEQSFKKQITQPATEGE